MYYIYIYINIYIVCVCENIWTTNKKTFAHACIFDLWVPFVCFFAMVHLTVPRQPNIPWKKWEGNAQNINLLKGVGNWPP